MDPNNPIKDFYKTRLDEDKLELIRFEESKIRESTKLDSIILLLITGSLLFSGQYLIQSKDMAFFYPWLVIASWTLLLFSLISHIAAYHQSILYHGQVQQDIKQSWHNGSAITNPNNRKSDQAKKHETRVTRLNNASLLLLIGGLIFITTFLAMNFLIRNGNLHHYPVARIAAHLSESFIFKT